MKKNILFLILLLGCTRAIKNFNEPVKTSRFSEYDTESVYLYIPSTLGAPRKITTMRPFYKGSEQLVKLKWTKQGLSVYSSDEDYRFDFSRNQKPVFTIPGEYKDFKCGPNHSGECLDEDNSKNWNERPYFFPNLSKIDFKSSLNILDLTLDDDGCLIERNANVTDYVIERGVINIEIEKEYIISKSESCITKYLVKQGLETSDLSFKTTFYYSLVRLKDLASPDYRPRSYSIDEQSKFGFFKNTQNFFDENYYQKIENIYLNRWNPKKKKVTYYLSDSFDEEGQEIFKQITFKAFEDINKVLKKAKVPFELELLPPSGKKSGDLRYNLINLITDPLANGLLGYGPSISNPLTGEILSASVNMYSGVLRSTIPTIYKKMEKLSREEVRLKKLINPALARSLDLIRHLPIRRTPVDLNLTRLPENLGNSSLSKIDPRISLSPDFYNRENPFEHDTKILEKDSYLDNLDYLTKHNAYPTELYLNGGRGKSYIEGVKDFKEVWNPDNTLKKWDELTKSQKEKITQLALPHAYRTTLIHEMGHNLGLRHNFKGSMDKNNFYKTSDFEVSPDGNKSLFGIKVSNSPQFSSIMDYGYNDLDELPIYGKYDIAALRFAYADEVELESGEIKKLDEKGLGAEALKKYEYCTDEEAGGSSLCDRFDEGTTYTEVMQHYERKYQDFYETRNFRNYREDYNLLDNVDYYFARRAEFGRVRKIFETWEAWANKEIFNQNKKDASIIDQRNVIQKSLEECTGKDDGYCKKILDIDKATILAGKFFLNILKMPNHECLLSNEKIVPLDFFHRALGLNFAPKSCFDSIIPQNFRLGENTVKVIAERGKYLKDLQEYNPKFRYSTDLAAKGIWIDKMIAMQFLVGRNLSLNRYQDPQMSFLDHPVLGPQIEKFIDDLLLQRFIDDPIPFKDSAGNYYKVKSDILRTVLSGENNPIIPQQISLALIYSLNLPLNSYFYLSTGLLNSMINVLTTADPSLVKKSQAYLAHLGVKKVDDHIDLNSKRFYPEIILSDGKKYAGSSNFDLASKIILDLKYFKFLESFKSLYENILLSDPPVTTAKLNNLLKKIYFFKMNPYLDISLRGQAFQDPIFDYYRESTGARKKSLEVSVKVLDEIIKSFEKDNIGEEYFKEVFSNESSELNLASRAFYLRNNLTRDELIKTKEFLLNSYSPPPGFPFLEIYNLAEEDILKLINLTESKVSDEMEDLLKGLKAF